MKKKGEYTFKNLSKIIQTETRASIYTGVMKKSRRK
jgi:hypothetical protein